MSELRHLARYLPVAGLNLIINPDEGADGVAEEEMHPATPLFFLSYARPGQSRRPNAPQRRPNRQVIKFFDDLSEDVAQLVSRQAGSDPGFMDQSISDGSPWTEELLEAIGTCQVLVPLLCEPFVTSEWCGMEWHAFSQRKVVPKAPAGTDFQSPIIPVIWAPMASGLTPPVIQDVQTFSPRRLKEVEISARYESDGVFGLMQTRQYTPYRGVVWRLAQRIANFHYTHWVEPRDFTQDELHNVFREQL